jgi:Glycosyl hydrolase family 26/S-layer homology domain
MSGKRINGLLLSLVVSGLILSVPGAEAEPLVPVRTDRIVAGLYAPQQWYSRAHINEVNNASSKKVSIGGIWFDITDRTDNLTYLLEEIWSVEATPFVNIHLPASASAIASGKFDPQIANMAAAIDSWLSKGDGRSVMLAPMPEMNGDWIPYGVDPANFKPAFRRFVEVANRSGSADWKVRWVFAPNGWSTPPHRMANYYPGADVVDLVGISAYNWGTNVPGGSWTTVEEAMGPALDEARTFALDKPFLVSQTASSPFGGDKEAWIRDMFAFLTSDPNAVGFIYFNIDKERDWTIWKGGFVSDGWQYGMGLDSTFYKWPLIDFFVSGSLTVDPLPSFQGTFWDDERSRLSNEIEWLVQNGITVGCAASRFCPLDPVTRGEMATFLTRAQKLPVPAIDYFTDDTASGHEDSINALREAGVTAGCAPSSYCPYEETTRAEMASFLVRAFGLAPSQTDYFSDDTGSVHEADINALRQSGITSGCTASSFCPDITITREQMAAFLFRSLGG